MNKKQYIDRLVENVVRNILSEAYQNLNTSDFFRDMSFLGFKRRQGEGSAVVYYLSDNDNKIGGSEITVHEHRNKPVSPEALRTVVRVLNNLNWFSNPDNLRKFKKVNQRWNVSLDKVQIDNSEEEIQQANELYKDALVYPVFNMKNSICYLKTNNGVNLCKNENDRRPLLPDWYEDGNIDRKTLTIPCMKRDNNDTFETECYPIKKDGTLDTENVIIETKLY